MMESKLDNANNELAIIGEFVQGSDNGNDSSNVIDRGNNTIAFTIYNPTPSVMPAQLFNYDANYFLQSPSPNVVGPSNPLAFIINPNLVEYCPTNNFMYVGSSTTADVEVIDCATNTSVTSIALNGGVARGMAYNSLSNTMYVCETAPSFVNVIDCATNTLITSIAGAINPRDIAYCPINNRMYFVNAGLNNMSVIDCFTNTIVTTIFFVNQGNAIAYNPVNNSVYAVGTTANLYVVDCSTDTLVSTTIIAAGFHIAIEYCPPNNTMYIVNQTTNDVQVVNCFTNLPIGLPINVGATPQQISYNMFDNLMYVTNFASSDISVIDCSSNLVVDTIPTASSPTGIAYNFNTNTFYAIEPLGFFFTVSPSVPFVASAIVTPSGGISPAEIYNDSQGKPFIISGLKIITDNFNQYSNNLSISDDSYTGASNTNQLQPLNYVSPSNPSPKILDIPDFNIAIDRGPDATGINFNVEPFTKVVFICTVGKSLDSAAIFSKNKMKVQKTEVLRSTGNPIVDMILKEDFKDDKDDGYYTTTEESIYPRLTGNPVADISLLRSRGVQGIG